MEVKVGDKLFFAHDDKRKGIQVNHYVTVSEMTDEIIEKR